MVRIETLVIVHRNDKVLLGLKKKREEGRNFGVGKWNGYGGGLEDEDNGDLEVCVCRETKQEAGIILKNLKKAGETRYIFEGGEEDHLVTIYTTSTFEGEPEPSDEMYMHTWFDVAANEIPYDVNELSNGCRMWSNDRYWMPYLLRGEHFEATITMTEKGKDISCIINGKEYIK